MFDMCCVYLLFNAVACNIGSVYCSGNTLNMGVWVLIDEKIGHFIGWYNSNVRGGSPKII